MIRKIVPICLLALLACLIVCSEPVDADAPDNTFYCYGNTVHCNYPGTNVDSVDISWEVRDKNGSEIPYDLIRKDYITVDATSLDEVWITQTVSRGGESDSTVMRIIPLHLETSDVVTVEFIDNGKVVTTTEITSRTVIIYGHNHVEPPFIPNRIGETFVGWFTDQTLTEPFDPTRPILENTRVYSKWVVTTVPGGSETVGDNVLVSFHTVPGLKYNMTGKGEDWISFKVIVEEGYTFREGTIKVEANGTAIQPSGNAYTIVCTDDIDVMITGERVYSITYDLTNVIASADGFDTLPTQFPADGISIGLQVEEGCSNLTVKVYSDGTDITASCVKGDRVYLYNVTGNILIVAGADFNGTTSTPMWWILVLVVAIGTVSAIVVVKRHIGSR